MVNFPLKSLVNFLQIRHLGTKTSKLVVQSTLKPVIASQLLKQKPQKKEGMILSEKDEPVITLLKKQHFSDAQIANLVSRSPSLLRCNVESNLEPKFNFLIENGFEGTFLTEIIVKNPLILRRSLSDHLIPNVKYLRDLIKNDQAALLFVVKRSTWLITFDLKKIVQPNIDLLLEEGMGMDNILKQFTSQPRTFLCPVARIRYGVETIKKFGLKPSDNMFTYALRVALSMSESNWKNKIELLKSLGWSDEAIKSTIVHCPLCFSQSEDKIKSTFHFLVKVMGLEPKGLMTCPKLLMYSLNKRIIPRYKVFMTLKEKNLLKDTCLRGLINLSEEEFTTRFILKHPTLSSDLLLLYRGNEKVDDIAVSQESGSELLNCND